MKTNLKRALALALALSACASAVAAAPKLTLTPKPGVHAYRYEVEEIVNGAQQQRYRVDFDVEAGRTGDVWAVIRSAQEKPGTGDWREVKVDDACRTKMRGGKDSLARVKLWPSHASTANALGPDFLDNCAPPAVFFPLTDILNVVVIPLSASFSTSKVTKVGDVAHFDGFTAVFDRTGETLKEVTHGGDTTLIALDEHKAVLDWAPALADLDLVEHQGAQPLSLKGTEHWAFRLDIDQRTGAIVRAHTTYDDLDLLVQMAGVPADKAPRVKISRTVSIESR
jgi:hypothetical protein